MRDDGTRWDDRYRSATPATAAPPEILAARADLDGLIPRTGHGLDVACGTGAATLWMAARGLQVTALDASRVAIDLLLQAGTAAGLSERIDARVVDLDDGIPDDLDDLDVIVCQRFRDPRIYSTLIERLRPGGVALVTVLSKRGSEHTGPFHAPPGELDTSFSTDAVKVVYRAEGSGAASIVVRRR